MARIKKRENGKTGKREFHSNSLSCNSFNPENPDSDCFESQSPCPNLCIGEHRDNNETQHPFYKSTQHLADPYSRCSPNQPHHPPITGKGAELSAASGPPTAKKSVGAHFRQIALAQSQFPTLGWYPCPLSKTSCTGTTNACMSHSIRRVKKSLGGGMSRKSG